MNNNNNWAKSSCLNTEKTVTMYFTRNYKSAFSNISVDSRTVSLFTIIMVYVFTLCNVLISSLCM